MSSVLKKPKAQAKAKPEDFIKTATIYARKVVNQTYQCRTIKLAAQRFLDDLKKQKQKEYPYYLDADKANRICKFAELMPHVKGKWAKLPPPHNLIKLEPWQVFIYVNIFAWLNKETKMRRFREAYIKIPRKNGKSVLAAVVGNYMLAADGEPGAEVYAGASSKDQADAVFEPSHAMAEKSRAYCQFYGVRVNAWSLVVPHNKSKYQRLVGNPGDGGNIHCAIVDEFHEHKNRNLYDTMETGTGARDQPLIFVITTAGTDISVPCYAHEQQCLKELEGNDNDNRFVAMWQLDKRDHWKTLSWVKAVNPNFGVSINSQGLIDKLKKAKRVPAERSIFEQKHCNMWTSGADAFFNMEHWDNAADNSLKESDFAACEYYEGLDLASAKDIASRIRIYPKTIEGKTHYYIFGSHYVPAGVQLNPDLHAYHQWILEGHLIATEGNKIDHFKIGEDILHTESNAELNILGYDGYNADMLISHLEKEGVDIDKLIQVPQTRKHLSDQMKWLEAELSDGTIHHDNNPVMNWMMGNVVVRKTDYNHDNFHAIKTTAANKIDGPVALITGAAVMNSVEVEESVDMDSFVNNPVIV